MFATNIVALILAAGKGTRMHSDKPKVLQELLGEPMLGYVYEALSPLFQERIFTVLGYGRAQIQAGFEHMSKGFIVQEEQLGTGHALQCAWENLENSGCESVLVVNGDTPLLASASLEKFLKTVSGEGKADVAFMTISLQDAASFGRVIRSKNGQVQAIIEAKDYDCSIHGSHTGEVNAGIYLLQMDALRALLPELKNENISGEFYITDLIDLAVSRKLDVVAYNCGKDPQLMGVNSPKDLTQAESFLRQRINAQWLEAGVMLHAPELISIGPYVELESGCEIFGPCELYGTTKVESGAIVASNCWISDSTVQKGAFVRQFCHLEGAIVGQNCVVGPYARLRPEAELLSEAKVGNFCEVKKSVIGNQSKVNHLSYIGDAKIGDGVNIGAGTITCNYDGKNKLQTQIKNNAFVGSNTALVAPVVVGEEALIAAGSVITKDVADKELAVARERQKNMPRRSKP